MLSILVSTCTIRVLKSLSDVRGDKCNLCDMMEAQLMIATQMGYCLPAVYTHSYERSRCAPTQNVALADDTRLIPLRFIRLHCQHPSRSLRLMIGQIESALQPKLTHTSKVRLRVVPLYYTVPHSVDRIRCLDHTQPVLHAHMSTQYGPGIP